MSNLAYFPIIGGIPQALTAIGERINLPWFGSITAVLVTLGTVGGITAWITATTRLPFVIGLDRYLPVVLGTPHPRFCTPHTTAIMSRLPSHTSCWPFLCCAVAPRAGDGPLASPRAWL